MSGEQVNLTLKEEKTTGNSIYIRYNQDTVIFHFEDITGLAAQRVLADKLWSMKHSNTDLWSTINTARLILISTLMPYEYCIANEKLRKIILSAQLLHIYIELSHDRDIRHRIACLKKLKSCLSIILGIVM